MPKKTRKEKIQSQERRQLKNIAPISVGVLNKEMLKNETIISTIPTSVNLTQEEINISKYFKNDLRKSLLIIGAIFALEIFFYFATMNNYLSRYLNF